MDLHIEPSLLAEFCSFWKMVFILLLDPMRDSFFSISTI